jgi:uncharacterized membrane protein YesL
MENSPATIRVITRAARDWWDDWVNMVLMGIVWLLCWITILLGPPATLGIYYVTSRMARGESLGLKGMLEGGRRYFLQSWLLMIINLIVLIILVANYVFYSAIDGTWAELLKALFIILIVFWLIIQFYTLPYLIEQDRKNVIIAQRNGLYTTLAAPGYTLVVASTAALVATLSILLVIPIVLGGPILFVALGSYAVIDRIETYGVREKEDGDQHTID